MSLAGMVEIPRPFDVAQDMLQAKRYSVMPAQAGIQCGGGWQNEKPGFPLSRERRQGESRLRVDANRIPRLRAEGRLIIRALPALRGEHPQLIVAYCPHINLKNLNTKSYIPAPRYRETTRPARRLNIFL